MDAFTQEYFKGNPAGVVFDAEGLTDEQMQSIARELNNSETAFILPPDGDDHELRVRYFTPTMEVPTCGHATIAAHYVRAIELQLPSSTVMHRIGIGTLPVEIIKEENDYLIVMTQGAVKISKPYNRIEKSAVLSALNISLRDWVEEFPIQLVDTGAPKIIVGVKNRQILNQLKPDLSKLISLSNRLPNRGFFVFTFNNSDDQILTHARMFAPHMGINEDPVTGNGNGPLGAYLVHNSLAKHDGQELYFESLQGEAIGRPGVVKVWVEIQSGKPKKVRVGGEACIVFTTEMEL